MESIGEKLRTQREQKGYSIEQIARDTNIAKRFLVALEAEDFSVFPGDPYLIGFLRNYADYLGIDTEEIVSLYRNFKIQSQPAPMDELIVKKDRRPLWITLIAVAVVAVLAVGGYFLYPLVFDREARPVEAAGDERSAPAGASVYELTDEILERRFVEGDIIEVRLEDAAYQVELTSISDELLITVPGGTNVLRIGDVRAVDLDGDADMDVKVYLTDIDSSGETKTVVARFDRFLKTVAANVADGNASTQPGGSEASIGAGGDAAAGDSAEDEGAGQETSPATSGAVGEAGVASREVAAAVLRSADRQEPFRISVIFRGYCLFRYVVDNAQREERYFHKGETLELEVTREARFWISNAGNLIARTGGAELDLGEPGEVSTRRIGWVSNDADGRYDLVVAPMY